MKHSDTLGKLGTAVSAMQKALGPAMKDSKSHHGKYADLGAVWDAARAPLTDNGLSVLQTTRVANEAESVGKSGVVVETILLHSSGEWMMGECFYPLAKSDPQGVGSAITYGRRYGLQAILGITTEDDDGNKASFQNGETGHRNTGQSQNNPVSTGVNNLITPKQLGIIRKTGDDFNIDLKGECERLFKCSVSELTVQAAAAFIEVEQPRSIDLAGGHLNCETLAPLIQPVAGPVPARRRARCGPRGRRCRAGCP